MVAVLCIALLLLRSLSEQTTTIQPISVPKALADRGYTPDVAAQRLHDALDRFANAGMKRFATYEVPVNSPLKPAAISLQADTPTIEVPTTGISLNAIETSLREFLGNVNHRISGELSVNNDLLWLRLRIDGRELYDSTEGADLGNPDDLFAKAAPKIFEEIQPYVVAAAELDNDQALKKADEMIAKLRGKDLILTNTNLGIVREVDQSLPWLYCLKGDIYLKRGAYNAALASLAEAIDYGPDLSLPRALLGSVYSDRAVVNSDTSDFDRAIAAYGSAIELDGNNAAAFNNRGNALAAMKKYKRAIVDYSEALVINPRYAEAFFNRATAHGDMGDYKAARDDYTSALLSGISPSDGTEYVNIYALRGITKYILGNYAEASADLAQSIKIQPDRPYQVLWLYLARARSGESNSLSELKTNSAKLTQKDWPFPVLESFLEQRNPESTLAETELNPDARCEAHYYIGQWHLLRKELPAAVEFFRTAATTCPFDFFEKKDAEEELKRLGN